MSNKVIIIGLSIIIVSILIYVIKNLKDIKAFLNSKKIFKVLFKIILLLVIIITIMYVVKRIKQTIENIDYYLSKKETDKISEIYDSKIFEENLYYKEVMSKEYNNSKPEEPYIPNGFSYVEGNWNNGFVIQDNEGNQYVWIPCTNKENEKIPILERKSFVKEPIIRKETCINEKYREFLNSALENGGFYISRYEIGKENNYPVSKPNVKVWSDVTRNQAIEIIDKMYEAINCELINGYAYDTTISWLMKDNKLLTNSVCGNKEELITGRKSYNNIYDLMDDVMEMTLETNYDTVIIRGYTYEDIFGMESEDLDRLSILNSDTFFTNATVLGFRTVLYK